ncbi:uncharacterized protein BJ171DRAFT_240842 [Polychytrium aggregatum]|uniref:uncharacterized protein n=1 Tax=Polychytrium aggregatum TaxID=110093 RepID=UPI0022FE74AE|nr:uncharacterized protein BJ171DRAFT_240842 [Polychytrium aggregatum]KAI9197140.1 hypothetical protein BJ171DRAFT_240842 [Polychytrium aggregatum]
MVLIELEAAFEDTPVFRAAVRDARASVDYTDASLSLLVDLASQLDALSNDYLKKSKEFASLLKRISQAKAMDERQAAIYVKYCDALQEVERNRMILSSNLNAVFLEPIKDFLATEIPPLKKSHKSNTQARDAYSSSAWKFMAKKAQEPGIEELALEMAMNRRLVHETSIDYCSKLNDYNKKMPMIFSESIVGYIYSQLSFSHQSYDTLKELEPSMHEMNDYVGKVRQKYAEDKTRENTDIYLQIIPPSEYNPQTSYVRAKRTEIKKSGYLYTNHTPGRKWFTWGWKYYSLLDNILTITNDKDEETIIDLRICTVKENQKSERRNSFDLITPQESYTLQAPNQSDMEDWIAVIQRGITCAFNGGSANSSLSSLGTHVSAESLQPFNEFLERVRAVEANTLCADCGSSVDVEWASVNLGIILCISCSGIHRGLGTHLSKIKGLRLDKWEPEAQELLLRLGNERVNPIFERDEQAVHDMKPSMHSDRAARLTWCLRKYVNKEFIHTKNDISEFVENPVHLRINRAVREGNALEVLNCIVHGADVNEVDLAGDSLLHYAVTANDRGMCELLLHYQAKINQPNGRGQTPLHLAALAGNVGIVTQLLRRGASHAAVDKDGETPLTLAASKGTEGEDYVKIITLLKLVSLNHENQDLNQPPNLGIEEILNHLNSSSPDVTSSSSSSSSNIGPGNGKPRSGPGKRPPSASGRSTPDSRYVWDMEDTASPWAS